MEEEKRCFSVNRMLELDRFMEAGGKETVWLCCDGEEFDRKRMAEEKTPDFINIFQFSYLAKENKVLFYAALHLKEPCGAIRLEAFVVNAESRTVIDSFNEMGKGDSPVALNRNLFCYEPYEKLRLFVFAFWGEKTGEENCGAAVSRQCRLHMASAGIEYVHGFPKKEPKTIRAGNGPVEQMDPSFVSDEGILISLNTEYKGKSDYVFAYGNDPLRPVFAVPGGGRFNFPEGMTIGNQKSVQCMCKALIWSNKENQSSCYAVLANADFHVEMDSKGFIYEINANWGSTMAFKSCRKDPVTYTVRYFLTIYFDYCIGGTTFSTSFFISTEKGGDYQIAPGILIGCEVVYV